MMKSLLARLRPRTLQAQLGLGFTVALAVGAIDEFHQMSLPGRAAGWDDLAFDALGAALGATALRWRRVQNRRRRGRRA